MAASRMGRPLVLIDLAVPRDIEPERARLPGHRPLRHGRPPGRGGAQPERAPGRGRGGARDRARGGGALRGLARAASTWCRRSPRCAAAATRSSSRCCARTSRAGSRCPRPTASASATLARAVVSRLLHEPTRRLRGAAGEGTSYRYVHALHELFGLEAALAPLEERARRGHAARRRAASAAAGDPTRHARQRAGAGTGATGWRSGCRARWSSCRSRPRATNASRGQTPASRVADKSRFVKEIEEALLARRDRPRRALGEGRAGASCRDGLADRAACPERADPRDALCGAELARRAAPRARSWARRACAAAPRCSPLRPDLDVRDAARQRRHTAAAARRGRLRRDRARPGRPRPARARRARARRSTRACSCPPRARAAWRSRRATATSRGRQRRAGLTDARRRDGAA